MRTLACFVLGVLVACGAPAPESRPRTATWAIAQVQLRKTTVAELRSALGDPDEQLADGSLAYRFVRVRGAPRRQEAETVRFRFEGGKLSKICRTRS